MPSLNVGAYIEECIESVIHQTLEDIEIICVDAGSTDGTFEILQSYAEKDSRIQLVRSEIKSYGYQVNLGVRNARGEYIGIVETDDYIDPNMYEILYDIASENKLDLVKADYYRFTDNDGERNLTRGEIAEINQYGCILDPSSTIEFIISGKALYSWAGIYDARFIKNNKILHHESPGASFQDNGFFFQVITQAKRAMFIRRCLYYLRRDNPNSSFHSKGKVYCACEEFDFIRDYLERNPLLEQKFAGACAYRRMCNYEFTLNRILKKDKLAFLQRYSQDFRLIAENGELDPSLYSETQWGKIQDIIECPEYVFYRYYYKEANQDRQLIELRKQLSFANNEISAIRSSASYKIGRFVTFVPRKVRGGIRWFRERGLRNICVRILQHFGVYYEK